jgi:hypothetical protein
MQRFSQPLSVSGKTGKNGKRLVTSDFSTFSENKYLARSVFLARGFFGGARLVWDCPAAAPRWLTKALQIPLYPG